MSEVPSALVARALRDHVRASRHAPELAIDSIPLPGDSAERCSRLRATAAAGLVGGMLIPTAAIAQQGPAQPVSPTEDPQGASPWVPPDLTTPTAPILIVPVPAPETSPEPEEVPPRGPVVTVEIDVPIMSLVPTVPPAPAPSDDVTDELKHIDPLPLVGIIVVPEVPPVPSPPPESKPPAVTEPPAPRPPLEPSPPSEPEPDPEPPPVKVVPGEATMLPPPGFPVEADEEEASQAEASAPAKVVPDVPDGPDVDGPLDAPAVTEAVPDLPPPLPPVMSSDDSTKRAKSATPPTAVDDSSLVPLPDLGTLALPPPLDRRTTDASPDSATLDPPPLDESANGSDVTSGLDLPSLSELGLDDTVPSTDGSSADASGAESPAALDQSGVGTGSAKTDASEPEQTGTRGRRDRGSTRDVGSGIGAGRAGADVSLEGGGMADGADACDGGDATVTTDEGRGLRHADATTVEHAGGGNLQPTGQSTTLHIIVEFPSSPDTGWSYEVFVESPATTT